MHFKPSIAVRVRDEIVRNVRNVLLGLNVLELAANETFGHKEGGIGISYGLTLGGNTYQTFVVLGVCNN